MTNVLRTLVLLTLATGQLLVAGQALAMPACHQAGGDMSAHAGMNHGTDNMPDQDQQIQCKCPQGQHCGHASVAFLASPKVNNPPFKPPAHPPAIRLDTAIGHYLALERPPPHLQA